MEQTVDAIKDLGPNAHTEKQGAGGQVESEGLHEPGNGVVEPGLLVGAVRAFSEQRPYAHRW